MQRRELSDLMDPGEVVRDVHRTGSYLQHGPDVGPERVPDHEKTVGSDLMAREQCPVVLIPLVAQNLDLAEIFRKTGTHDLGLLVPQVALGNQHEGIRARQERNGLGCMIEQFHICFEQVPGNVDDISHILAGDFSLGQLDRGFDHRKGIALDSVSVLIEIAHLGAMELIVDQIRRAIPHEKLPEAGLGFDIVPFVVPEGIVSVKSDHLEARHGSIIATFRSGRRGTHFFPLRCMSGTVA